MELATRRVDVVGEAPGHQCGHICHEVAERCVKDQPVDGLVEGLGDGKGGDDKHGSYEREAGADSFEDAEDVQLRNGVWRVVHICVGASHDAGTA